MCASLREERVDDHTMVIGLVTLHPRAFAGNKVEPRHVGCVKYPVARDRLVGVVLYFGDDEVELAAIVRYDIDIVAHFNIAQVFKDTVEPQPIVDVAAYNRAPHLARHGPRAI